MSSGGLEGLDLQRLRHLIGYTPALISVLNRTAASLRERVLKHGAAFENVAPGFGRRFVLPFQAINRIEFGTVSGGAAYVLAGDLMTVNVGHVRSLLEVIVHDVDTAEARLKPSEIGRLVRLAIELFLLHEVRHHSQGVSDYADVQKLKAMSEKWIGQFDLIADRDAAQAYALLRAVEEGTARPADYVGYLGEAFFFMGQFCFPAFKAPLSKPSKIARALGITLMLARITVAHAEGTTEAVHAGTLPLDATLMPEFAEDWSKLTIFAYNPDLQLVAISVDIEDRLLRDVCERLDDGNFEQLLPDAIRLLRVLPLA